MLIEKKSIHEKVAPFAMRRDVFKELGEPILIDEGDVFFIKKDKALDICAFSALSRAGVLKYMFVESSHRGNGLFSELYQYIESYAIESGIKKISAVSTAMALPMYQKKGFGVIHSYTNYHKIAKQL